MMASKKDIHSVPFDEGTNVKLILFQEYVRNWLPVFLANKTPFKTTINIFDFFAGPGETAHGDQGSPMIIIDELKVYVEKIKSHPFKVNLYFNELKKAKYDALVANLPSLDYANIEVSQLDFKQAFDAWKCKTSGCANLLFLDQYGVKHVTEEVLKEIISIDTTDFLMFISSSTLRRFAEHPAITKHIKITSEEMSSREYVETHRVVTDHFRSLIGPKRQYHLVPFSIKKGANIYGLIFGSGHLKGVQQFLSACWKIDPERGEANFDIDDDNLNPNKPFLFDDWNKPKKLNVFEKELSDQLASGALTTKDEVKRFALTSGFLPKHTTKIVRDYEKDAKVSFS